MSFSFSWSQSCRSPTCLCSRTLCMSWTSLMVLFLQRQQQPPRWSRGLRQSSVNSLAIERRLPQWFSLHVQTAKEKYQGQSFKVPQGKHLHWNKTSQMVRKCICLQLKCWFLTVIPSLPCFPSVFSEKKRQTGVTKKSKLLVSLSREEGPLLYIHDSPLYLPTPTPTLRSSMSHLQCWCWCHFSNALMGTGICMTPVLATNSSFDASAECPVCHTSFKPCHIFCLCV